MPQYIDNVAKFLLEDCDNISITYNPEFIAQGDIIKGLEYPDMILIGSDNENIINNLKKIYSKITVNNPVFNIVKPLEAEIIKLSINGYITTKLSFCNMISDLIDNINKSDNIISKDKILYSIGSDTRIGNKYFKKGYSFGGPCFPRDTKALKLFIDKNNINSDLLKSTIKYNEEHIINDTNKLLLLNKQTYVIENVCFKENSNINIIEESAKLKIALLLIKNNKKVIIKDIESRIIEVKKLYGNLFNYEIINNI